MKNSKINWTDHTFNPWWGCVRVSEGCVNCYAETMSKRTGNDIWGVDKQRRLFGVKHWREPVKWNQEAQAAGKSARVFCSSMADVFEDRRDLDEQRAALWFLIERTPWLKWLLLTKRPESAIPLTPTGWRSEGSPQNVWYGTTAENQKRFDERIGKLAQLRRELDAHVLFLSVEPMLEPIGTTGLGRVDWVICGGESGAKHRPFEWDWARDLRDQCRAAGIAFWMKQGGGIHPPHEIQDLPEDLRIRELPPRIRRGAPIDTLTGSAVTTETEER